MPLSAWRVLCLAVLLGSLSCASHERAAALGGSGGLEPGLEGPDTPSEVPLPASAAPVETSGSPEPGLSGAVASPDPAGGATPPETAAAMARALTAADQARFLALVARGEPNFYTESRHFAQDLARAAPKTCDIDLDRVVIDGDVARAALRLGWRMSPERAPRTVSFPARFVHDVPPGAGWLYAGEDWLTLRAQGVAARYLQGYEETARRVVALLPAIRLRVHATFLMSAGAALGARETEVKLYPSQDHLQASIYLSYDTPLAGWNEPGEAVKLLANPPMSAGVLALVLAHEYTHVATFELGPRANDMPWWVLEGVADVIGHETYDRDPSPLSAAALARRMQRAARERKLVPWEDLADFHGTARDHAEAVYEQGRSMVGFVSDSYGRARMFGWLVRMANGASLAAATADALGLSFAALDRAWRAALVPVAPVPSDRHVAPPL